MSASSASRHHVAREENSLVAYLFREASAVLESQGANPFRVAAYRRAAQTIDELDTDLRTILERAGSEGLIELPGIGAGLAAAIREILTTGKWSMLERLEGTFNPEVLFQRIPGVGPELARHLHEELHVDSLEALEDAAHDGRLEAVSGVGPRRAMQIRGLLSDLLGRARPHHEPHGARPSVDDVLEVDREYRRRAQAGELPKIAPRRLTPAHEAWLPILHTHRGPWHYTALFSNTARAHQLGRTHDWVVLYFHDGQREEQQHTVVTERRGPMKGKRVVRGRELECRGYWADRSDDVEEARS
jgi:putative hydrolase